MKKLINKVKKLFDNEEVKQNVQFTSVLVMIGCIVYNCSSYFEYASTF